MKGKFYVIEGADHCGKGTQTAMLVKALKDKPFLFTREPGSSFSLVSEKIRELIIDPVNKMDPLTEAYLYAASRADNVAKIEDHLANGWNVVCERYYYSSIVYQGYARELGADLITAINSPFIKRLQPDVVFYLDIDLETLRIRRKNLKSLDRLEQESDLFFSKVIEGYRGMFWSLQDGPATIITLNGNNIPDEIHKEILKYILP